MSIALHKPNSQSSLKVRNSPILYRCFHRDRYIVVTTSFARSFRRVTVLMKFVLSK